MSDLLEQTAKVRSFYFVALAGWQREAVKDNAKGLRRRDWSILWRPGWRHWRRQINTQPFRCRRPFTSLRACSLYFQKTRRQCVAFDATNDWLRLFSCLEFINSITKMQMILRHLRYRCRHPSMTHWSVVVPQRPTHKRQHYCRVTIQRSTQLYSA